jgi:hypothetical protein
MIIKRNIFGKVTYLKATINELEALHFHFKIKIFDWFKKLFTQERK